MKISREDKKVEAVARMKQLGIFSETVKQFEKEDLVSISEPPLGAFYWATNEDMQIIRDFEEKYNALVYVVVRSYTTLGKMDAMLYVSDYNEEWDMDRQNIVNLDNGMMAYVYNHDMPDCSEFGYIGVKLTIAAGLQRVW